MGDWMTVRIVGICKPAEVRELHRRVYFNLRSPNADYGEFGPLSSCGGLCGLPMWAKESFDVTGNCAERGYDAESVAEHLRKIVTTTPSLSCKVHCGGSYESTECVATVTCMKGEVVVGEPEVKELGEIPEGQMMDNFNRMMIEQSEAGAKKDMEI